MLAFTFLFAQGQSGQGDKITVSFTDVPLEVILDSLTTQTGYYFSYNSEILPKGSRYTISATEEPVDQFLSKLLIGTGLKYSFFKDQVILTYEEVKETVIRRKNLFSISGKVLDENGKALSSVNIFLDGTSIGTTSDIDGNYKLESIPPGLYDIVFSHIGYENAVYQISEYNGGSRIQRHQMEIDLGNLQEVEVVSNRIDNSSSNWLIHYQIFKQELLGTSKNAAECVIENPEALSFSFDDTSGTLRAFTSAPLVIRNDALGYRISYYLESFRKSGDDLRYRGRISFRNLAPLNKQERRKWKRNREENYNGSFSHFKKSLLRNELKKEGFRIYQAKQLDEFKRSKQSELDESDIIVFKGDHYELDFRQNLIVEYRKEKESLEFLRNADFSAVLYGNQISEEGVLMKTPGYQISIIRLLKSSAKLDLTGEVLDKFALTTYGYWSWERLADLVPNNYDPRWDNL
ncbi:MAG: hypothetical protein Tsb0034_11980 [Ekhidna sp.]